MRKIVNKKWLKSQTPCSDGFEYWIETKKPNLFDFIYQCKIDAHLDWASWLIVRCMDKKQYQRYAIYAAEQVLYIFEKKNPKDKRPRTAIAAAKKVIQRDTLKNRAAAYAAASAADAAASAAYAAAYAASYAASAACAADAAASAASAAAYAADAAASAAAYAAYAYAYAERDKMRWKILKYGMELMGHKPCIK